ncbi:hypothetical protein AVEN_92062-1, partial [Araneus ventricosus]
MQKEKYEEWMSVDDDIPVDVTPTDLEICQADLRARPSNKCS